MNARNPKWHNIAALPPQGRILALDIGAKRVGVAISDTARTVALSRGQWPRAWKELKAEIIASSAVAVVLGLPLHMSGDHGPEAQGVQDLATLIEAELGLPVVLWDERLTSRAAEAAFFEQRDDGRAGRRQTRASKADSVGHVDTGAAVLILQGVLDRLRT
jgi:putative Holliday junction resolvase